MSCYNTKALSHYLDRMDKDDIEDAYRNAAEMKEQLEDAKECYKELQAMLYGKDPINTDNLDDLMLNLAVALGDEDLYNLGGLPTVQRFGQEPNFQAIQFIKRIKS